MSVEIFVQMNNAAVSTSHGAAVATNVLQYVCVLFERLIWKRFPTQNNRREERKRERERERERERIERVRETEKETEAVEHFSLWQEHQSEQRSHTIYASVNLQWLHLQRFISGSRFFLIDFTSNLRSIEIAAGYSRGMVFELQGCQDVCVSVQAWDLGTEGDEKTQLPMDHLRATPHTKMCT